MPNPLRSEAAAFRFVVWTLGYFAVIAIASVAGGRWVGLGVFVSLSVAATWWFLRRGETTVPRKTAPTGGSTNAGRILVIANETVGGAELRQAIERRSAEQPIEVLVVTPALNSPLRHWVSDEDGARAAAQQRLDESLVQLRAAGISAQGEIGDAEPLQAIEDALRTFGADEIVISTHPEGRSNWLEQDLVTQARERFSVTITHVVVS